MALEHANADARAEAAQALAAFTDPQAVAPLLALLEDPAWEARKAAASALGKPRYAADVLEPLTEALGDDYAAVRTEVARSLGDLGTLKVVEPLLAALNDRDGDVRRAVARSLGMQKDDRAEEALLAGLADNNVEMVAGAYAYFIRRGKDDALPALIDALNRYNNTELALAFLHSGNPTLSAAVKTWAAGEERKALLAQPAPANTPGWGKR
jgi:HEAT repeat protein